LHDVDYEYTKDKPEIHSLKSLEILKPLGINQSILDAIETHNEIHQKEPISNMAKSLFCLDSLTGLIVASVLVLPSKKISEVSVETVLNRFKEKAFARGANREHISRCEKYLNLSLEDFVKIVLESMKGISNELGL
jgi:predicted hydrolase (HD superfamily)